MSFGDIRLLIGRGNASYECDVRKEDISEFDSLKAKLSYTTFNDFVVTGGGSILAITGEDEYPEGTPVGFTDQLRLVSLPSSFPPEFETPRLLQGDAIVITDQLLPAQAVMAEVGISTDASTLAPAPPGTYPWAPSYWTGLAISLLFQDTGAQLTVFFCNDPIQGDFLLISGPPTDAFGAGRTPFYHGSAIIPGGINELAGHRWLGGSRTYLFGYGESYGLFLMVSDPDGNINGIDSLLLWDPDLSILGGGVNKRQDYGEISNEISLIVSHSNSLPEQEVVLDYMRLYPYASQAVRGSVEEKAVPKNKAVINTYGNGVTQYPMPRSLTVFPWEAAQTWGHYDTAERGQHTISGGWLKFGKNGYGQKYIFRHEIELQEQPLVGAGILEADSVAWGGFGNIVSAFPPASWLLDIDFHANVRTFDASAGSNTGMGFSIADGQSSYNFRLMKSGNGHYISLQEDKDPFQAISFIPVDRDYGDWRVPRKLRVVYNPLLDVVYVIDRDSPGRPIFYKINATLPHYGGVPPDHGIYLGFLDAVESDANMYFKNIETRKKIVSYEAWWDDLRPEILPGSSVLWLPDQLPAPPDIPDCSCLRWTKQGVGTATIESPFLRMIKEKQDEGSETRFRYAKKDPIFAQAGKQGFVMEFALQVSEHISHKGTTWGYDSFLGVGAAAYLPGKGSVILCLVNIKPYGPAIAIVNGEFADAGFWDKVLAYDTSVRQYIAFVDWKQRREYKVVYTPDYGVVVYVQGDRRILEVKEKDIQLPTPESDPPSFQFGVIEPVQAETSVDWEYFTAAYANGWDVVYTMMMEDEIAEAVKGGREVTAIICPEEYIDHGS